MFPDTVTEKSEIPDLDESSRQDMKDEPLCEHESIENSKLPDIVICSVLVRKNDGIVFERHDPLIRHADAMRILSQILKHLFRSSERSLEVYHPIVCAGPGKQIFERSRIAQF